ncbi:MAG: response regulator transcription factor [Phaeodactylibacter sp.]|nr:response regulator transcription factor [Phaeodactylibacter sp.]MCB9054059.1 response regulator transcription factor [Lewinellaceae bacterium]
MNLRFLIIDDEPLAHKVILEYARDVPFLEPAGQYYSATEALAALNTREAELIFLDIQMPKLKGLDFLRTLNQRPLVIVTSAYEEYALESFELDVCDYLLKPFRFERFLKAVNKAYELHQLTHAAAPAPPPVSREPAPNEQKQLFIKADKRFVQVNLADIFYLESYGNYVKVWQGEEFLLTPRTLASFEGDLPESDFFRIHKSYIVQRQHIDYVEGNTLHLKNGKPLPIGKSYRQEVKQLFL